MGGSQLTGQPNAFHKIALLFYRYVIKKLFNIRNLLLLILMNFLAPINGE